ncbi:MAG: hypothetical protein ACK5LV_01260 [Lachnospirales bacterium]
MKWETAKNSIIIFLIIVNVTLFTLGRYNDNKYSLTIQQEKNVMNMLGSNKVSMYIDFPKESMPMATLTMEPNEYDYNKEKIAENFLGEDYYISSDEEDKQVYSNGENTITFENGFFYIALNTPIPFKDNTDDVLKYFGKPISSFTLDRITTDEHHLYYEYREKYKKNIIYTNRLEFCIEGNNIISIEGYYARNIGYGDNQKEIISVDMALFTFVKVAKEIYGDVEIFIEGIDVVYYQEEYFSYSENNNITNAMPCYRIYVRDQNVPFIINAYTNKVINY